MWSLTSRTFQLVKRTSEEEIMFHHDECCNEIGIRSFTQNPGGYMDKRTWLDFPGGPVVKNTPSNAGDAGSIPGRGTKIPHAMGQLSPSATVTQPVCSAARVPQRKILHAATKIRCSQINKLKKKKKKRTRLSQPLWKQLAGGGF